MTEDKQREADRAIAEIRKELGQDAIVSLGERVGIEIPSVPTGIYSVDHYVAGCGGIPKGRITEIFGPESGGKTTLTLRAVGQAQAFGNLAAFIDVEHALDPTWAARQGVDVDKLLVSQPGSGEEALKIAERLIHSAAFDIVVIDSVAALIPQAELDGELEDTFVGVQARLMSKAMRKLTGPISKSGTAVVFINQIREKIGVTYGNPEVTTGGRALKFYASLRLEVRKSGANDKEKEEVVGHQVKIKGVKNKVGTPFRETVVKFNYEEGFDRYSDVLDIASLAGVVEKSGSWYSYKGERMGQGKDAAGQFIRENDLYYEIVGKLVEVNK